MELTGWRRWLSVGLAVGVLAAGGCGDGDGVVPGEKSKTGSGRALPGGPPAKGAAGKPEKPKV